jgi:chromosome segregation ATPase
MASTASALSRMPTRAQLERRLEEINAELRDYPQPIARCDAQLGGLLEERSRIRAQLDELQPREG